MVIFNTIDLSRLFLVTAKKIQSRQVLSKFVIGKFYPIQGTEFYIAIGLGNHSLLSF
jgi:hypothetical protein